MRGYPQVSFRIPMAHTKIWFSRIVINHASKNTSVLVGTVLKHYKKRSPRGRNLQGGLGENKTC